MFCTADENVNVIWFNISYINTINSQADITGFFADNNVNIQFGYFDNTGHAETGKYIIFTQVEKSVDVEKLVAGLKGLDVVHDVEYGISSNKMVQSVEFPLNLLGERAIISRATTFVDIIRTVYENVPQSDGLMMLSGLKSGIHAAKYFKGITTIDENNFKDILKELLMATGWGILDIEYDRYRENERPVCGYMSGYFAGFITEAVGKTMRVREVRCKSMGHDVCEHVISLAPKGVKLEHLLRGESI